MKAAPSPAGEVLPGRTSQTGGANMPAAPAPAQAPWKSLTALHLGNHRGMSYLDFDMQIGAGAGSAYPVTVLRSPAGSVQATMQFPFDERALKDRLKDLQLEVLRAGMSHRRIVSPEAQSVQDFGQQLFEALFAGSVSTCYAASLQEATKQKRGLRLRLHIQAPELAVLPWEYLYDPRQGDYLCLSRRTALVRYLDLPLALSALRVQPPLRILGMLASPSDQAPLDIAKEQDRMRQALMNLHQRGLVELIWLEGQTWRDLQRAMRAGPWHIWHFIGHGGFDPAAEEGLLALTDEDGKAHLLRATEVGRLLANHDALRLVILNACEGAKSTPHDLFSSTAAVLARRGIPAVLAMQYPITDRSAIECIRAFYEAIADGLPVEAAVAESRTAMSLAVPHTLEWGTPVLYLRATDGVLFDVPVQSLTRESQPGPLPPSPAGGQPPAGAAALPGIGVSRANPINAAAPSLPPIRRLLPVAATPSPAPSGPSMPQPMLLILSIAGTSPPLRVLLPKGGLMIGRDSANDLVLADSTVSRRHLHLTYQGQSWHVTRLTNTGPLYVNGHPRDQAELQECDQLVIGGTVLRLEPPLQSPGSTDERPGQAGLAQPNAAPLLTVEWPGCRFAAPLREEQITLGRAPTSGLVIPSPAISAHHATLQRASDGGYLIENAESLNGLTFQGKTIQRHRLQHGDQITIGSEKQQWVTLTYTALARKKG